MKPLSLAFLLAALSITLPAASALVLDFERDLGAMNRARECSSAYHRMTQRMKQK